MYLRKEIRYINLLYKPNQSEVDKYAVNLACMMEWIYTEDFPLMQPIDLFSIVLQLLI